MRARVDGAFFVPNNVQALVVDDQTNGFNEPLLLQYLGMRCALAHEATKLPKRVSVLDGECAVDLDSHGCTWR